MSSADGDAKPAAIASMAARASALAASCCCATCLSEKSARKRTGSGVASEQRLSRRLWIVARVFGFADAVIFGGGMGGKGPAGVDGSLMRRYVRSTYTTMVRCSRKGDLEN